MRALYFKNLYFSSEVSSSVQIINTFKYVERNIRNIREHMYLLLSSQGL
jgi:hypothetical protein